MICCEPMTSSPYRTRTAERQQQFVVTADDDLEQLIVEERDAAVQDIERDAIRLRRLQQQIAMETEVRRG